MCFLLRVVTRCRVSAILAMTLVPVLVPLLTPAGAAGQDVEMLNRWYGNRPPDAYYETLARDPNAFRFSNEGRQRLETLRNAPRLRSDLPSGLSGASGASASSAPLRAIGPRDGPLEGTFRFPLILGLFSDGPQSGPFSRDRVEEEFFAGPNSHFQTIPELYTEMSGGRLLLEAVTFDWVQTEFTRAEVTLNQGGLLSSQQFGVGAFIESVLKTLDAQGVDWAQFDLSGDGYVDVLTVMHPYRGRECQGDNSLINSHRWSLQQATGGRLVGGFVTSTPYDGGGFIRINDYTIQPLLDCGSDNPPSPNLSINRIGVFAHELGHAFGLPDLYAVSFSSLGGAHEGVGRWDLMSSGSWGCRLPSDAARPCHMGAWSKAVLGWVDVEEVGPDELRSVLLQPVLQSQRVLRVPAMDGSREYLLLENRQRIGSDVNLEEPGLLIWHVDQNVLDLHWRQNTVNTQAHRMGVRLVEADGQGNLTATGNIRNRGDAGDPFPGCIRPPNNPFEPCTQNRSFHIGTHPAARAQSGSALGVALTEIELVGAAPHDVSFQLDTRFAWDTIRVTQSAEAVKELSVPVQVSGVPGPVSWHFASGTLPPGISFHPGTMSLTGSTFQMGTWQFELTAADGPNRELLAQITLQVVPPSISFAELVAGFLGVTPNPVSVPLVIFLDANGNQNGGFDLGDARAFIQGTLGTGDGSP